MHIQSITLTNFRCFGSGRTTINLGPDITALIGANGAGKSACLEALRRLFGETRQERTLTRADVHFGPGERPEDVIERNVVIDVVFALPELASGDPAAERTVPEVFRVMTAVGPGNPLKARLRLEAQWRHGESYEDEIDEKVYWVSTLDENIEFGEEGGAGLDKQPVQGSDRSKIRLVYVPATRDGNAVTRQAMRNLLRRLERSGDFGPDAEKSLQSASSTLQATLDGLPAVDWITRTLEANWGRLHEAHHLKSPRLTVLSQEFVQLLRSLNVKLGPGPDGRNHGLEELSEGQTSLFFLALSATLSELEQALAEGKAPDGFTDLDGVPPALTVYAVEEPENHLAPFYLARLMDLLKQLCKGSQAMGIVTSHAPSVMRRIPPENVQHVRLDSTMLVSHVNGIRLPADADQAAKFVREAVLVNPEIYFAKLVILGEGDSEEVVLPHVAQALGIDLDPAFVAFAPLGGRHVNHFWRLLGDLKIPYLTLLDFDLGRHGAGALRLKYAYEQLRKIKNIDTPAFVMGADVATTAYWKELNEEAVSQWKNWFSNHGVYFSFPVDLDMMMLRAFPAAYGVSDAEVPDKMDKVSASVFGQGQGLAAFAEKVPAADHPTEKELVCYDTLFKKRSKPASHLDALARLGDDEIKNNCPQPLRNLITKAAEQLRQKAAEDTAEG